MADRYLSSGTNCCNPCSSGPQAEAYGDARIGGDQDTPNPSKSDSPAVEQQDVQPWAPESVILAGLAICLLVDAALFAAWLWMFRGVMC